jgi:SynChlorMet cassette protein ScmD
MNAQDGKKPIANPSVVLREEFDDWAVLFDPDTGDAFGLNPTGVFVWKLLNGERTSEAIIESIRARVGNLPEDAAEQIEAFVDALISKGLAGFEYNDRDPADDTGKNVSRVERGPPSPGAPGHTSTIYESPGLVDLNPSQRVNGASCLSGSVPGGYLLCYTGDETGATDDCGQGNHTEQCHGGGTASWTPCTYAYGCCHGPSANPECHSGISPSYYCNGGSTATSCTSGTST